MAVWCRARRVVDPVSPELILLGFWTLGPGSAAPECRCVEHLSVGAAKGSTHLLLCPVLCLRANTLMAVSLAKPTTPQGPPSHSGPWCLQFLVLCISIKVYNHLVKFHKALVGTSHGRTAEALYA